MRQLILLALALIVFAVTIGGQDGGDGEEEEAPELPERPQPQEPVPAGGVGGGGFPGPPAAAGAEGDPDAEPEEVAVGALTLISGALELLSGDQNRTIKIPPALNFTRQMENVGNFVRDPWKAVTQSGQDLIGLLGFG